MSHVVVVVGTDTGVGKTWVTAGLAKAAATRGMRVVAVKPIETGCTTATRVGASTSMPRMRSSEITSAGCAELAPADSPVPAPRGTTGTPARAAMPTASCTCSVVSARTTAIGSAAIGSSARSQR